MSGKLVQRIDKALDALDKTPQLLAHVPAEFPDRPLGQRPLSGEGQFDRATDTQILWQWITGELRLVLEALGKDKKAASCLAKMLPKPYAKPLCYVNPRKLPVPLREEYDRKWAEAERQRLDEYTQWINHWRAEVRALQRQIEQERASGHSTEQAEAKLIKARNAVRNWERNIRQLPKECGRVRAERYGKDLASGDWSLWSEAFQAEVEKIAQREKELQHKWEAKFAGEPAVWLWMVWNWYPKCTRFAAPAGLPEWPEFKGGGFSLPLAFDILLPIGSYPGVPHPLTDREERGLCPGKAANYLKQALEKLRRRLKSDREPNNKKTESLLDWAGASKATLAIVYTDIDGSTNMCNRMGNAKMIKLLATHLRQARRLAERTGGHVIKDNGDGVIAAFRTAPDALWFAMAFQAHPGCGGLSVRAGVDLGLVYISESNAFGSTMNYAARVVDEARPARVCLSSESMRQIRKEGDPRLCAVNYEKRRNCELKGFGGKNTLWYAS